MESGNFHTPSDEVVTRGASAGRGNSTLDFLYLSDGWLCRSSENRVNDFNVLEVYHAIRGNLGRVDELFDDNPHGNEMDQSQKGLAQFLIPRGNASKLFEFVKEPFHLLP